MRVVWVCVVQCCEVRKYKKNKKHWEHRKTKSPLLARHGHPRTPKRSKNGQLPQRLVLALYLGFADAFATRTPKKAFLGPKSYSKGPNHALESLTSETPNISTDLLDLGAVICCGSATAACSPCSNEPAPLPVTFFGFPLHPLF